MTATTRGKRPSPRDSWNIFDRLNYRYFLAGIGIIILGYIAMMQGPWNSFWSLHLAPILLLIGYCVLIPIAILKRSVKPPKSE
jgi:hypothetical protein